MKLISLLLVIAMSAGAGLLVLNLTSEEEKEQEQEVKIVKVPEIKVEEVPKVDVVVARQDLAVGTVIEPQHLDRQPWPTHLKLEGFIVTDGAGDADLNGRVVRSSFKAGEPILKSKLANPEDPSFLAASLAEGMRAVTIPSSTVDGVAGFIYPGDHVDVLVTHSVNIGSGPRSGTRGPGANTGEQITEVLVEDVRVLATDQKATAHGGDGPKPAGSITLELSRIDAQRVRLAGTQGKLSLTLRSLKTPETEKEVPPTSISDLSRITPPSYFPVLYDNTTGYSSPMVDVFESIRAPIESAEDAGAKEGAIGPVSDKELEELRKGLTVNAAETRDESVSLSGQYSSATAAASLSSDITVVRGTAAEIVGVNRP